MLDTPISSPQPQQYPFALRKRFYRFLERFPVVCLFFVTTGTVLCEPILGNWLSYGLLGLLLAISGWSLIRRNRDRPLAEWEAAVPKLGLILLSMAVVFAFYHQRHRQRTESQILAWNAAFEGVNQRIQRLVWEPIALRGTIDESITLRPSYFDSRSTSAHSQGRREVSESDLADLSSLQKQGWQSTTLLRVEQVRDGAVWRSASFLVTLTIDEKLDLLPGDRIETYGKWKLPSIATNPGQHDASKYYAQRGYSAQVKVESKSQITPWGRNNNSRFDRYLSWVRQVAMKSIDAYVPFQMSTLASALILGQRNMAEWELQEELLATGTIHMLAISGLHVEMIASALLVMGTLSHFRRSHLLLVVCLTIWAYSLLCGGNPPVMRAAIMMTLAYAATLMGWQYSSLNNLALSGIILTIARPSLVFEVGPQLSFIAVAVLILTTERLPGRRSALKNLIESRDPRGWRAWRRIKRFAWDLLRTSFWVWFITAPIVWSGFHVISPIGILLNLVLWIPMLIALVAGLGMILVGWLPVIGHLLGFLCGTQLVIVDKSVDVGEQVPFGHFWVAAPPAFWLYGFYGIVLGSTILWGTKRKRIQRLVLLCLIAWFGIGLLYNPVERTLHGWFRKESAMVLTFLDVGHGTNVWIETPDGELWMYDAGRLGDNERSYRRIADALWYQRYSSIDTLILSHADSDHYNAMSGLLKRFRIGRFVTTPQVILHDNSSVQELRKMVHKLQIPEESWQSGTTREFPTWKAEILHPSSDLVDVTDNAMSLCMLLEFANRRILLPGDLEPPGIQKLVEMPPIPVDVVMAPHHGSLNAQANRLMEWCQPSWVVISGSYRAASEKVDQYFSQSNRKVLVTSRDHAIRLTIGSNGDIAVAVWNDNDWQSFTMSPGK